MQWVIDHAIVSADKDLLTTLVIGFGILMLLTQLTSLLQSWISMYISTTLNIQWKANVFHHLTHLPSQFFQKGIWAILFLALEQLIAFSLR